jgi:DHA2 family methylenomycin A resistance protein-like MFS transporter
MGVAVPGLVAGATEALGPDRAGIASAVNNTSRQVGGAIGVALIGGLASIATSLLFSGVALILGGAVALVLMGRSSDPRTNLLAVRESGGPTSGPLSSAGR